MKVKNWDELEKQFETGSFTEIQKIHCPDCGGKIRYEYTFEAKGALGIKCLGCGKEMIECGIAPPPWVKDLKKEMET